MKVEELIEILKELEQDKKIFFSVGDNYYHDLDIVEVDHFENIEDKKMKKSYCLYVE